ncbi:hypothetical protein BASA60_003183 [Batrachochytrium salamandrivorans]|nr:hypothetical protein BASA60_003183 [Batrachochytrium salamandrivorans]
MRISIATVCSVAIFTLPSVTAWGGSSPQSHWPYRKAVSNQGRIGICRCLSPPTVDGLYRDFTPSMDPSEAKCVYDDHRDCADGICLSSAIARHNKILMESTSPDDPGAEESMKYIIHYVSDVCQPLHTDERDEGGSLTLVRFGGQTWSLHTIWDKIIPEKRVLDDFKNNPVLYASYLIRSIKTGENKVPSESWTSKLPINAVNDIGNSMAAIEYTAESYELACSVIWPEYDEHRRTKLGKKYYGDFFKTVDMQISKAGLRVAKWLNDLARLHSQTKVETATLPAAQPGKSNIERHPSPPRESMPQSKKGPSMSSKQLVSGAQKPDDPPPPQSDHDDHQAGDYDAAEWQVVKKKGPREQTTINKGIRLFTGARLSTAIGPLLVETGIGSLLTRSLVSRVRLLERSVTKRTPINAICSSLSDPSTPTSASTTTSSCPPLLLLSTVVTASSRPPLLSPSLSLSSL